MAFRRFVLDAASIELRIEDDVEHLVTLTPLPLQALLAAFGAQHGRVMLGAAAAAGVGTGGVPGGLVGGDWNMTGLFFHSVGNNHHPN